MDDENTKYYKKRYMITFYKCLEDGDEQFVASFDNIIELCQYKKLPITDQNLSTLKNDLYRVLKRCPSETRMLDGSLMRVYLIDMLRDDDEEEYLEQERRDKCMAQKKYVQITSTMNIEVYASLEAIKIVGGEKKVMMNAKSGWAKIRVLVTSGTSWYPSEVLNWPAVKTLVGKEIFTIGAQSDTISNPETLKKAEEQRAAIAKATKDVERERKRVTEARKEEISAESAE